jgi:mannose-1-phosphate guanylyltransferase/mannose-1-phosphate guanylyltransferase/mannose-6-phosphate isomerase
MGERIHPVILSGGSGTRLWPLSRRTYPKHLLPLVSERSLLQETVLRVRDAARFAPPLLVANEAYRFVIGEQLEAIGAGARTIMLEPAGRNTAPAIAAAALLVAREDPQGLVLVLPSDHVIADAPAFQAAIDRAAVAARDGRIVAFGIAPRDPETGYGYIRAGQPLPGAPGCLSVARFVEKPERAAAEAMLAEGGFYWNGGMFLFRADVLLAEIGALAREILEACRAALAGSLRDLDFLRLEAGSFARAPAISFDHAVMERTAKAALVPVEIGWSDVGSWSALWALGRKDPDGNVLVGDVVTRDVRGSYIRAEGRLVAAIGVEDLIVIVTGDAVLLAPKSRGQDIKQLVERLEQEGRGEAVSHPRVHRPWGSYQRLDAGERFQVKRITVKPGAKLSLQKHARRAEHWVVVRGIARVTIDGRVFTLEENQSSYVPVGSVHRLENPGPAPLDLIEVQTGAYLGEDDIVRLEDAYGRGESEKAR